MHSPSVTVLRTGIVADLHSCGHGHLFLPVHPDMMLPPVLTQVRTWRVDGTSLFGWFGTHYEQGRDADWVGYLPIDHLMPHTVQ